MASGYTKISNELLKEIYKSDLTGTDIKVLLYVIRMTIGFPDDYAKGRNLSATYIAKNTSISLRSAKYSIAALKKKGYIRTRSNGFKGNYISVNFGTTNSAKDCTVASAKDCTEHGAKDCTQLKKELKANSPLVLPFTSQTNGKRKDDDLVVDEYWKEEGFDD